MINDKKYNFYIYVIENKINNKTYTGQRKLKEGLLIENDSYMGSGNLIKNAIKKYGIHNFKKYIIWFGYCSQKEINEIESYYIKLGKMSNKNEYNIKDIGSGGDLSKFIDYSYTKTDEHHKKISEGVSNYWNNLSDEKKGLFRKKISLVLLNRDEETKEKTIKKFKTTMANKSTEEINKIHEKRSNSLKGNKNPAFGKHWYNNGIKEILLNETDDIPDGYKKGSLSKIPQKWKDYIENKKEPVVNINTGEIFNSIADAVKKYPKAGHLNKCFNNLKLTAGGYHWCKLKDYKDLKEENVFYILIYYNKHYKELNSIKVDKELLAKALFFETTSHTNIRHKHLFKIWDNGKHYQDIGQFHGNQGILEEGYYE